MGFPGNPNDWNQYLTLDAMSRWSARDLGIEPAQLQAGRWTAVRDRAIASGELKVPDRLNLEPVGVVLHGLAERGSLDFMKNSSSSVVRDVFDRLVNLDPALVRKEFGGAFSAIDPLQAVPGGEFGAVWDTKTKAVNKVKETALDARLRAVAEQTPEERAYLASLGRGGTPQENVLGVYEQNVVQSGGTGVGQGGSSAADIPSASKPPITRSFTSIDDRLRAAGLDPYRGYLSPQQRTIQNQAQEFGDFRTRGVNEPRKGQRTGATDDLRAAYRDSRVNVTRIIGDARKQFEAAYAAGDIPGMQAVEERLLDHGQAAVSAGNRTAYERLHTERVNLFGAGTETPAGRAAHWQAVQEQLEKTAAMMPGPRPDLPPATGMGPRQVTPAEKGAIDRGMVQQERDTGQFEAWRAGQPNRLAPYDPNAPLPSDVYGAGPPSLGEIARGQDRYAYAGARGQTEQPIPPTGIRRPSDPTIAVAHDYLPQLPEGLLPSVMAGSDRAQFAGQPWGSTSGILHGVPRGTSTYPRLVPLPPAEGRVDWNRAQQILDEQGRKFAALQQGRGSAAVERGNRIVGNFREQTPIGEMMTQGTMNGSGPGIALVPFAPFHIHTTQYWANYFLEHPQAAFAVASALNQYHFDEYGGKQIGNKYVSGLLELSTAAHLIHWAEGMYKYAQDVRANPNGNNRFQQAAKVAGMGLFGNEAFVRPFDYISTPAQGILQSTTNPLLSGKTDFTTGLPLVDKREQISEQGSASPITGGAQIGNQWLADRGLPHLPRDVVANVTNPGQWATNQIRRGGVAAVNALGGNTNLKEYNAEAQLPYFAGAYARDNSLDPKAVQRALYAPTTPEEQRLGNAIRAAYRQQQDTTALGKLLPVRVQEETAGVKGIFPPSDRSFAALDYAQRAGEGGTDAGLGRTSRAGNFYLQSPDEAQGQTARNQLKLPVTRDTVPTMDYARDYLTRTGNTYQYPNGRTETQALANRSDEIFQGTLDANARKTGAGLPQDQRLAKIDKTAALQTEIAPGFTVQDFLNQPGNLFDLYDKRDAAYDSGDKKGGYQISLAINDVIARDLQQHPEVKAYFDTLKNGGVTASNSTPTATPVTSSPSQITSQSPTPTTNTTNPRGSTAPVSKTGGSSYRGSGPSNSRSSRSPSTASGSESRQAGNDFYDFYKGITDKGEKAAILSAFDRAGLTPFEKGTTAEQYRKALEVARDALLTDRARKAIDRSPSASGAAGRGMTAGQALAEIARITGGMPGGSREATPTPVRAPQTSGSMPGGSPKAPAGYYYDHAGTLRKSKLAA